MNRMLGALTAAAESLDEVDPDDVDADTGGISEKDLKKVEEAARAAAAIEDQEEKRGAETAPNTL
jgi:hypothetical protein